MNPRFEYGEQVRVVRTLRSDGTFPGAKTGDLLARAGSLGYVRNAGTFEEEQIIYAVHFPEVDLMVGCCEEELISAKDPWVSTRFLFWDQVVNRIPLSVDGQVVVAAGTVGEVVKIFPYAPDGPAYHVSFDDRVFKVPETALDPVEVEEGS